MEIKAYCIGCIRFQKMVNPKASKIGPGKKLGFKGKCPDCGRFIFILDRKAYIQEMWGK